MNRINFKKISVIVSTCALFITSIFCNFTSVASIAAFSNMRAYYKYDASDGDYSGVYVLSQANSTPYSSASTRSIVNPPDTRTNDTAYNGVVKLIGRNNYLGSGFIVNEHVIATAAHCVYNNENESEIIDDILVFNANNNVATHLTPVEVHIPCSYIPTPLSGNLANPDYDYALITVEETLSTSEYNYFNLSTFFNNIDLPSNLLKVTGFPQEVNGNRVNDKNYLHSQYTGTGNITNKTDYRLYYDVDTSSGNSGGPVYVEERIGNQTFYSVLAIHTTGSNYGTRINVDIMKFFMNNDHIDY